MNEIYWLTRIAKISDVFEMAVVMGVVIFVLGLILSPVIYDYCVESDCVKKIVLRIVKAFGIIYAVCFIGYLFTPTSNEMLAIYGLGSTIDYIKSNDKAKELPNKVVDALERYVDAIAKEEEGKKEE